MGSLGGKKSEFEEHDDRRTVRRRSPMQDSWVDAVATLLATVVFGLGWTLVELERADPPPNRYDAVASGMWMAAVLTAVDGQANEANETIGGASTEPWEFEDTRWTERAQPRSNR